MIVLMMLSLYPLSLLSQTERESKPIKLNLEKCIELTLSNNKSRGVAVQSIKAAEAKVKQAQSGHYPSLDLNAAYSYLDEDPNFVMPGFQMQIPPISLGSLSIPSLIFPVPDQNVKLANKQNFLTGLDLVLPLFTGGKISSYIDQAKAGLAIAQQDSRSNDEEIIYETKKMFFAVVLARNLDSIATDTYERMKATLSLTETLYQNGSGRITKSDYLKNKMMVEALKTMCEQAGGELQIAKAALINTMGLEWNTTIDLEEASLPQIVNNRSLEEMMNLLYSSNPMFAKMENALTAYSAKVDEIKSDYFPSFALFGSYKKIFNSYDYGMVTPENKNLWIVGIGMKLNIFNGWRTESAIEEKEAELNKLEGQKHLLHSGLTLKLQYLYYKFQAALKKESASQNAMESAAENRIIVEKGYFNDILEFDELMQAQLMESFMKAQYQLIRFECSDFEAQLNMLLAQNTISTK
jgi:outer membrane protein